MDHDRLVELATQALEYQKERIDREIEEVRNYNGNTSNSGKRRISAAHRAAVSARMKAYWAARRAANQPRKQRHSRQR